MLRSLLLVFLAALVVFFVLACWGYDPQRGFEIQQLALQALDEVENALDAEATLATREELLRTSAEDSRRAAGLTEESYRVGKSDLRDVMGRDRAGQRLDRPLVRLLVAVGPRVGDHAVGGRVEARDRRVVGHRQEAGDYRESWQPAPMAQPLTAATHRGVAEPRRAPRGCRRRRASAPGPARRDPRGHHRI